MIYNMYSKSELLTEKEKDSEDYLMSCVDSAIGELVYDKYDLRKAYNYYNGERDEDQFKHLEDAYSIGTPTSIEFIPLVKKHIDRLIGEHLQNKLKPKITCKDKKTIAKITEEKKKKIFDAEMDALKSQLNSNISYAFGNNPNKTPEDLASEQSLAALKEELARNFTSTFEIAAQHMLTHMIKSKTIGIKQKLKTLFLDLLVAGQCYYKVYIEREGATPTVEVLNPFDVFYDRNPNSPYIKDCTRVVLRRWMNKQQIINRYGHMMTDNEIEELDICESYAETNQVYYVRGTSGGIIANTGVTMGPRKDYYDEDSFTTSLIPVYEVEWVTNNKDKDGEHYRLDRYQGVRIGASLYLDMGKSDDVTRSIEAPHKCYVSINGISYSDRNSKPYSLVLATANLQDKYDVLHFHRDNLIANSGVQGDWLDVSMLPEFLGSTPSERLAKWTAYKKAGKALINTAQEGRGANHNTIFGGFDDTVKGDAIQAIQYAIDATEAVCSSITGVFREMLNGIEQRDAVTNIQVGTNNSSVITKQYFNLIDDVTVELLIDLLNNAKVAYKKGFVGTIILGDATQKIFTVEPEHFTFTDYDVHIGDSGDIIRDMQKIEMITMELIKGGVVDVDVVLEAVTSESLTEMKETVIGSVKKRKEENNQMQQMQQQVQQYEQQMQELQKQLQSAQQQVESLKAKDLQIKEKQIANDYELRKETNRISSEFNSDKLELDKQRVELEKIQLMDDNLMNDEVLN